MRGAFLRGVLYALRRASSSTLSTLRLCDDRRFSSDLLIANCPEGIRKRTAPPPQNRSPSDSRRNRM
jgi:hypothetical protein